MASSTRKVITIGDVVYIQNQELQIKLDSRFEGTYRVIDILDCNKLKGRHLTTFATRFIHLDQIKRVPRKLDAGEELPLLPTEPSATPSPSHSSEEYRKKLRSANKTQELFPAIS